MKVLIADALAQAALDGLAEAGFTVVSDPALSGEALADAIRSEAAEVLIVRSTKVPRAALAAAPLGLVVRAGAGYNNVDVTAASELGIYVANCPGKNAIAVAELAWGLILSLDRSIPDCVGELRCGRWDKKRFAKSEGLYGRTLGVVGVGAIGREVISRAKAFGMPVVAWSRSLDAAGAKALGVTFAATPGCVAEAADVVSVHVALTDQTRGLIDDAFLGRLKVGAFLINTSRGDVVDGAALARAIADRGLRCGLDVWNQQPKTSVAAFADPLGASPSVYGTHHIGASTQQAQVAVALEAVRVASTYLATGDVPNCVNLSHDSPAAGKIAVRHRDRVGVLAGVLEALRRRFVNVLEMENIRFAGGDAAACATISVSGTPGDALLGELRGVEHVLDVRFTAAS